MLVFKKCGLKFFCLEFFYVEKVWSKTNCLSKIFVGKKMLVSSFFSGFCRLLVFFWGLTQTMGTIETGCLI